MTTAGQNGVVPEVVLEPMLAFAVSDLVLGLARLVSVSAMGLVNRKGRHWPREPVMESIAEAVFASLG